MFKNTKKSAEIACISADFMIFNRLFVVPPVLLKLNFNQTDFIELITNTLCIKHF